MRKSSNWGNSVWPKPAASIKPKNFSQAGFNKELAITALHTGVLLTLTYDGLPRVVEVHTVGVTTAGRAAMSAYQIDGQSNTPPIPDWRLFCFDECFNVAITSTKANSPRAGYKRRAKPFGKIDAEI
ncbi:hypothetical protein HGP17_30500 [Rhizobium sp. P38BS-XIX]|uniref:hypothetical protein n=1 Tax=Rhizobium sp. P38BS-XIX TaxID=2726740 RepID=UPI001456665B|nr:hypothetical protein [Rhizobium sp. P38BS-XIX]NLS01184.1 hypothetical protein [Rhizobium sp. P38BS-XIX]